MSTAHAAVAPCWATAANPVHALPRLRSTLIGVALAAVLVHARLILAREVELATRLAGAVGAVETLGVTLMVTEVVFTKPPLSVTVKDVMQDPTAE